MLAGAGGVGEASVWTSGSTASLFTGSVETGKTIAARCAERWRGSTRNGRKDPFIVCADVGADVGRGRARRRMAAYLNAGRSARRRSASTSNSFYDEYLQAFVDHTDSLWVAIHSTRLPTSGRWPPPRSARVVDQVEAAVGAGATLVGGGEDAVTGGATTTRLPW